MSHSYWQRGDELARLDPALAGLYTYGHQLLSRLAEPGAGYLLAHAGRELCRGVVGALAGQESAPDAADDLPESERNRGTIGVALGLPPAHASVTLWFRLNGTFSRNCHFRAGGPDLEALRKAFGQFSELLYGRIAPYFATHAELDELLQIEKPSDADLERARTLLVRHQQRRYFFSNLKHSAWLRSLADGGHFGTPPDRVVEPDGSWRMRAWPEGEYLVRVAASEPELVTQVLLMVPSGIQNPAVWAAVADAARALPVAQAVRLVPTLEAATRDTPPILLPDRVVALIQALADARERSAFRLAECLLWFRTPPAPDSREQDAALTLRHGGTDWMLARITRHHLDEFLSKALPALERFDPGAALRLLCDRLARAVALEQRRTKNSGLGQQSRWFCQDLERAERSRDVRAALAVAAAQLARRAAGAGPEEARMTWDLLIDSPGEIFQRIRWLTLAVAGEHLTAELDAVVGGDQLLDPPFGAREAAALLRARFAAASPGARNLFKYALERGPDAGEVRAMVAFRKPSESDGGEGTVAGEVQPTDEEVAEAVGDWQRRRLRWFHDRIPLELQPLAERLGVNPEVPSVEAQALDEVGFYSGGAVWVGERSPRAPHELATMDVEELVSYLREWRPDNHPVEGPSVAGLEQALTSLATEQPELGTCQQD